MVAGSISTEAEARDADWLLSADAVRRQAHAMLGLAQRDALAHWRYVPERLDAVAGYVAETIRTNHPDLAIPRHARWRHFVVDGEDQWAMLSPALPDDPLERARLRIEFVTVSVLLDAGAGDRWRYRDETTGRALARSEGLAIAGLDAFMSGLFSTNPARPLSVDAAALQALGHRSLARAFQSSDENALAGLAGRVALLNRLGRTLVTQPQYFGDQAPRLGNLADHFCSLATTGTLAAPDILIVLLDALSDIWPGRLRLAGRNLGDTWRHPQAGLVPFHKLSQWLALSLIEPLEELGLEIVELDGLTGLAEYRNGGLMIDLGAIEPKNRSVLGQAHKPDSPVIVEWRALTVALLDLVAARVRALLGMSQEQLPLASVLEGGTWSAGRRIAKEKRPDGSPPLAIVSDGSVF